MIPSLNQFDSSAHGRNRGWQPSLEVIYGTSPIEVQCGGAAIDDSFSLMNKDGIPSLVQQPSVSIFTFPQNHFYPLALTDIAYPELTRLSND
jgi:hypothetical protein